MGQGPPEPGIIAAVPVVAHTEIMPARYFKHPFPVSILDDAAFKAFAQFYRSLFVEAFLLIGGIKRQVTGFP